MDRELGLARCAAVMKKMGLAASGVAGLTFAAKPELLDVIRMATKRSF